jgi:cytoskeletal protein CcmA (bactofilin family)
MISFKRTSNSKTENQKDDIFFNILSFLASIKDCSPPTIINSSTVMDGQMIFNYAEVSGTIKGFVMAQIINIRHDAKIEANILADSVEIHGSFKGKVKARIITIHPGADVSGDMEYAYLIVNDGVILNGNCIFNEDLKQQSLKSIIDVIDSINFDTQVAS